VSDSPEREEVLRKLRVLLPGFPDIRLGIAIDLIVSAFSPARIRKQRLRAAQEKGRHTPAEWRAILRKHGGKCAYCGSNQDIHKDHIIPISRGGSDGADNIQPLCVHCNCSKWANL